MVDVEIENNNNLGQAILEFNKQAKVYKELENLYGIGTETGEKYKELKKEIYKKKQNLLKNVKPVLIHRQLREKEYVLSISETNNLYNIIEDEDVIGTGVYKDKETGEILKYKKIKISKKLNYYSLYYVVGDYRFHEPIAQDEYYKMENILKLVDENELKAKYNLEIKDYK